MKIRMAMIGGGLGSFIGPVHRYAATMDGTAELVAGAFSSSPEVNTETGTALGLAPERVYHDFSEMLITEAALPEHLRPHIIVVITPNHLHFGAVTRALETGFHVICDKPLCITSDEATEIMRLVESRNLLFCITYNYTGYPMVKRARELVRSGSIGRVTKIAVEYFQGWLSSKIEDSGNRQAGWRTDPARAGISGCMADIGTHAFNLAEYISGVKVTKLLASLNRVVDGRRLDDDGTIILEFEGGIPGSLLASQVATGEENNLRIAVYGTKGGITWEQMNPNSLVVKWSDRPTEIYRTGTGYPELGQVANLHTRLPAGHPEGFIEAFANIYRNFSYDCIAFANGNRSGTLYDYPGIEDGVRGIRFLEAAVASDSSESWKTV